MSKAFKGLLATVIGLVALSAFLLGVIVPNAGRKVDAETPSKQESEMTATADQEDAQEIVITDSAGNEFTAPLDADNIITLNDVAYEMMTALGKGDLVTGTSQDTKFPESAGQKEKYGTEKQPETDKIIQALPGVVLVTTEFTKSDNYTKLKDAGIKVIAFDLNKSETTIEEVAKLGLLFDAYDNADGFITDVENIKSLVAEKTAGKETKNIYWEKTDDYTSILKEDNETRLSKDAYLKSITEDRTDAKTDNQFIKEKNPDVIIKTNAYDSNILTLEKADTAKAKETVEGITKRDGLTDLNVCKDKKILLLSERVINTPLGSAIAPLYAAKMAYPDEMKDVNPGDYLKSFFDKYWGADLTGALAYFGNLSDEENSSLSGAASTASSDLLSGLSGNGGGDNAANPDGSDGGSGSDGSTGGSAKNSLLAKAGLSSVGALSGSAPASSANADDAKSSLLEKAGDGAKTTQNNNNNSKPAGQGNNNNNNNNNNSGNNSSVTKTDDGKIDVSNGKGPKEVISDSRGTQIVVDKNDNTGETAIKRCIVFNSSVYEMIKVLGQEKSVIGIAESMTELAPGVPTFGTWKEPNAEAVIEAKPDVVFAYADYGQEAVAKIKNAGIAVISLNFYVPNEIPEEVVTLGKVLGAESVAEAFNQDVAAIQNLVAQRTKNVTPVKAYWEGYTDYKSVGNGSGGAQLMTLAHVNSLTAGESIEYPVISDEWILERQPEVVVKMASGSKNILGPTVGDYNAAKALYSSICSRPGWNTIPAVTNKKVLILNSTVGTTAFGSAVAPLYIAKVAYPRQFADVDADKITREFYQKYWGEALPGTWRYYE